MKFTETQITNYYSYKDKSYRKKYQNGHFTHLHVGLYAPSVYPFLFVKPAQVEDTLDLERIQYLLFRGQEDLSILVNDKMNDWRAKIILDCGCGYCGTSIFISQNNNSIEHIDAISLSEKQISVSRELLKDLNIRNVSTEVSSIFDFRPDKHFDVIFSLEAISHIEDYDILFNKLNSILLHSGKVIISDYFLYKNEDAKERLDFHWKTNISHIEKLVLVARQNGFIIEKMQNLTLEQMPFWVLSQCHSKIVLKTTDDNAERERLEKSIDQHEFLYNSFLNTDIQYYFIVLSKS